MLQVNALRSDLTNYTERFSKSRDLTLRAQLQCREQEELNHARNRELESFTAVSAALITSLGQDVRENRALSADYLQQHQASGRER